MYIHWPTAVRRVAITLLAATLMLQPAGAAVDPGPLQVPFHHQETNGCGPASVAMVQMYWFARQPGVAQPVESELRRSLPVTETQGTLLSDMRAYLDSNGYHAFTIQAKSNDLSRQVSKGRIPIVALKNKANTDLHYVVVTGLDQHKVWLNDPAKRRPGSMDRRKFEEKWTAAGSWMLLAVPRGADSRTSQLSRNSENVAER